MSDNYYYESGATHNDRKKIIHIDSVEAGDFGKLISVFLKEDAEYVSYEEVAADNDSISENPSSVTEPSKPNYFAPKKHLQELLKKSWFKECRTNSKYDEMWADAFVSALMESEWKDLVATDWATKGKRSKIDIIKGNIVGLLVDNGVLRGNYDSIAKKVGISKESRTFSRYMGAGKKQPYADWVGQYIKNN